MNANIVKISLALTTVLLNGSFVFAQSWPKYPDYKHWKTSVEGLFDSGTTATQSVAEQNLAGDADGLLKPVGADKQRGTGELQEHILGRVNDGVVNGWLTPAQASDLKKDLNRINEHETLYRAQNSEIPASVLAEDEKQLHAVEMKISAAQQGARKSSGGIVQAADHSQVDMLIAKALTNHRISSEEAEKYYLRLAELDSLSESVKHDHAIDGSINGTLHEIQSELLKKLK
jgi:hypothetical protein